MTLRILAASLLCLTPHVLAQTDPTPVPATGSPLSLGYTHQLASDFEDGGELSTDSYYLKAGIPLMREPGRFVALTARYQWTGYDFDGAAGTFGALDPWDEVHDFRLGLPFFWELNQDWNLFAIPSLRLSWEDGADAGDAISGGLITGATYQWSERLSIGPGLGVSTQLEDDANIFPIIYFDWKVSDSLSLTTRPSGAPVAGPGITGLWQINDRWSSSFGVHFERLRFRLQKDNAAAPEGVGEYSGIPLYTSIAYQPGNHLRFALFGGIRFGNEVRLEDSSGSVVRKEDTDPSPFFGVNLSLQF